MDDKKKEEDSFETEEVDDSGEVHEEKVDESAPESEIEPEGEPDPEETTEMEPETQDQPRKFFHSSESQPEIYVGSSRGGSGKKIYLILGVLALVALGAFFYSLRGGSKETKPVASPSPSSIVESTPTPVPSPSFNRSKYKIRVLNGTSTQGLAASASAKLKGLGYEIEKTANATNSAFLKTVVRVKVESGKLLENLLKDLISDFQGEEGPALKSSDTADGEVILGKE